MNTSTSRRRFERRLGAIALDDDLTEARCAAHVLWEMAAELGEAPPNGTAVFQRVTDERF